MNGTGSARILSRLWLLSAGVVAIAVLYVAKILFLPLAFAVLFAFLLAPLVARLERLHLTRTLAAIMVILAFAALLACSGWIFFTQLVAIANDLPTYRGNIAQKMAKMHRPSDSAYSRAEREIERLGDELGLGNATPSNPAPGLSAEKKPLGASPEHPIQVREVSRAPARLDQLGGILEPLTTALLSVVFTFFVLLQREDLRNRVIHLTGERNVTSITQAMRDASARISRYFSLQLLVNTIYGAVIVGVLYFLGLPHALLFGTLATILRFVPYIGWMGAAALPTVLSLAVFHGWQKSLIVLGTFLVLEVVTGNYVEPHIYGKHTGLSALAILIAAAFWTLLWGPVGLVLSVPLTVCLVVIGSHMPALEFLTIMLGDQPSIQQWTCFYQRLLAHDGREAGEILESALRDMPLDQVYDGVLIPALVKSEEDRQNGNLEESSVRFIRHASREFVEELGFRENHGADVRTFAPVASHGDGAAIKVMCVPVRDETDELAALMAAQVFEGPSVQAVALPASRIDEVLKAVAQEKPDVVLLSALPPFGLARSHRIYSNLRARDAKLRIMIGIWNYPDDPAEAAKRISGAEEGRVWTRLSDALAEVRLIAGVKPEVSPVEKESAA
ncbi:AI-2E family transporter [Occallatibacter riparius]|uniref:AI-2E family transporter n=1 Tax=Occallatibacter riparius TaxID=1002689 RepID=A0A9J7BIQ0_9BACT|nr:AI-2E family transporter [Occallatibacter riparius]UWZ82559.1 AI-2E family transporter [Occallatibacter riparius]